MSITCFGDRACGSFLGLSDKDNSVSWTDNFVNVFSSVTSPPILSYHYVSHYFLTMSVDCHFNSTFGLKPQDGGIKIVHLAVHKRSIFQVEWLIAHCVLNSFLTMSVGLHFNLTFGLKPEVDGIKIVCHCLQTIYFPSWVAHSRFNNNNNNKTYIAPISIRLFSSALKHVKLETIKNYKKAFWNKNVLSVCLKDATDGLLLIA